MNPTAKITSSHLSRLAIVYVRQSTVAQVRQNTESTNRQYGLAGTAAELGWMAEQIVVVDADLGVSGRFGSERDGYRQIVARMCLGEVGAVFGLEVSRFGRSNADLTRLMELARLTDTLLIDVDGVYDLASVNDRILLGLKGQMSEIELHFLLGRLHGAKLTAAHRGELRHPLPVGFVYDEDNTIVKDPDEQVQGAVADLFAEFHRTGSALGVMRAFAETGRLFPQRAWGGAWAGKLKWGKLTHARVLQALKNPTYAGVYTFGKTRDVRQVQPDGSVRTSRRRRARDEWTVLIEDHHDGYVSWPQYLATEAKLAANNTQQRARPVREGTALCQGIICCGVCGGRVGTRYDRRDRKVSYTCQIKDSARTSQCRTVAASTVDDAVSTLLLNTITPEQIAVTLAAADEVVERHTRTHRAAELAVQRARYDADRAERAFSNVEPENRLVARTLESRWEAKLAALAEAETALVTAQSTKPPLPAKDSLQALAADLPRLWHAETTSPRDRKRLLRTLIADVTLLPEPDPHTVRVGVRWHTGATDELSIARPGPGRTPNAAVELMRRHGPTHTSAQLAELLNAAGLTSGKGKPYTAANVASLRHVYKIYGPRTVAVGDGEVSVKQAAAELGIPADAVYNWLRLGQVPARRGPSGRWCIPWDPATQEIYRQKVAGSFRLTPTLPAQRTPPQTDSSAHQRPR